MTNTHGRLSEELRDKVRAAIIHSGDVLRPSELSVIVDTILADALPALRAQPSEPKAYLVESFTAEGQPWSSSLRFYPEPEDEQTRCTPLFPPSVPARVGITEEMVERAIEAHYELFDGGDAVLAMRAALEAALAAQPTGEE